VTHCETTRSSVRTTPDTALESAARPVTIALAGQPNVGKSTIFNILTGLNQHVGNWPGKTVEQKMGECTHHGMCFTLVDLPGTYSLTANSEEERIAREYIIREQPDVVIAVVDAAILERSLYLLAELLALPSPVVLALNMMDVAEQQGIQIEAQVLQAALGVPVVPMSASRAEGVRELLDTVGVLLSGQFDYCPSVPTIRTDHQVILDQIVSTVADYVPDPYSVSWIALKLLEGDVQVLALIEGQLSPERWRSVQQLLRTHEDAILDVAGARYDWIGRMIRAAVVRPRAGQVSVTERLDRVATHPLWGIVALLGILGVAFWLTYALGTPMQVWLDEVVIQGLATWLGGVLAGAPAWVSSLLIDGVLSGAGLMVTFVPILVIFFAILGVLEDTGYMARGAYVMDRFMHLMGLHGKSFLPLCLGFGCNVPAVMGSRILESRRARLLTILLAPLVPCTARMAVLATLVPVFFPSHTFWVTWGLVGLNLAVLALVGIVLSRTVFRGGDEAFIMELPLYHTPNLRTIGISVWQNLVAFVQKAGTVILAVSVVIWALSSYPGPGISNSVLAMVGRALEPVGRLMGLDWPMLVAMLTSFVAKENTIATLGILYNTREGGAHLGTALSGALTPAAALAFLAAQMLFVPCVGTVAATYQETRSWRWTLFGIVLLLALSFGAGVLFYQGASLFGLEG